MVCWEGSQIACWLVWLHRQCILHGDLTPGNILVVSGPGLPTIKIGDFGSATFLSRKGTEEKHKISHCITTYPYAAPEMPMAGIDGLSSRHSARALTHLFKFKSPIITLASDNYSMGIIMMELSGGQHPQYPPKTLNPPTI